MMATYTNIDSNGSDLERVDYTLFNAPDAIDLSRPSIPVIPPIIPEEDSYYEIIQEGTDLQRVDYSEYTPPRPDRIDSGEGDVSAVQFRCFDSGEGDISANLEEYQLRNGNYYDSGVN